MNESAPNILVCPGCGQLVDVGDLAVGSEIECPTCGQHAPVTRTFHHYRLDNTLGEGGMGVVYLAQDLNLNRVVAIKVLKRELSEDRKFIANFLREVEITASLTHPNIVQVFAFGEHEGQYYLVMEYIGKHTFDDEIMDEQQMHEEKVIDIAIGVASGLNFALQRGGLIHRDIKPGNILIGANGVPKVVDFGLALTPETAEAAAGAEIWGTPYYVSPERLEGKVEDFRSDMYSLGVSLYHALAGRPPFDAKTAELVAAKHLSDTPLPLKTYAPSVSDQTTYAITRAMARQPDDRFQSYNELIEQMEDAKRRLVQQADTPAGASVSVEAEIEQSKMLWIGGLIIGIILTVVGALLVFQYSQSL
ncbi:MAG: serine/threonine-protein kinase [Candidatus Methylacidiphilales bacterium]|nr:serine/threonine-protein kinase [Candidatus Methylacidiphilales bacterium]